MLTLPLTTETWQEHLLEKRLNLGRNIYNACLGEALLKAIAFDDEETIETSLALHRLGYYKFCKKYGSSF
ncbi:hypothetical protein GCM10026983_18320 [Gracilibacillus alcaliphilus]